MFDTKTYVKHIFKGKETCNGLDLHGCAANPDLCQDPFLAHGPAVYMVSLNVFLFIVIEQIIFYLFERVYCCQTL